VHFLPGKLGYFGPISNELDGIEEVLFLCAQLLKAILFWQVLDQDNDLVYELTEIDMSSST
jgi:hypothetical protein